MVKGIIQRNKNSNESIFFILIFIAIIKKGMHMNINRLRKVKTLALITFFLFLSCRKDELEIDNVEDFESFIEEEMEFQQVPAMSVLIFKGDQILYEKYFGQSNIEQSLSLTQNHLFLLASISKAITATSLLQLYDQGYFELDDFINDFLPFEVNIPNASNNITFRMLLTHTSGIADGSIMDSHYYYGQDSPISLEYFMENYFTPGGEYYSANENFHNAEPGDDYQYSNVGSALIGVLVEQISGQDFNSYCKENIFDALEMSNTFWRLDEIDQTIVTPYNYNNDYTALQNYTFTDYPNGGLRSNAKDMFHFLSMLAQNGLYKNNTILQSATVEQMTTPQIPELAEDMGLHLFTFGSNPQLWGHDGGEEGTSTIMAYNKSTKIGAIVLTNMSDVDLDEILEQSYNLGEKL
jgi:CubicO group peptidase (beta-lactamase class C family)